MFLTATAPAFMHRMGLLVAKMKSDGSFDAHELNSEGVIKSEHLPSSLLTKENLSESGKDKICQ